MQQALYYLSYFFFVFFLYKFIRERKLFQLMFVIWSVTVILSHFIKNNTVLMAIGIAQFVIMIVILILLSKGRRDAQNAYLKAAAEYEEHGTVNGVLVKSESEKTQDEPQQTNLETNSSDSDNIEGEKD